MCEQTNSKVNFIAIRGATTSKGDTNVFIKEAVIELIQELISLNNLDEKDIISITFTVTNDLTSCFPAAIARKYFNLNSVAFLDCQQMFVPDDIDFCIRLLAIVNLETNRDPLHPYLNGSSKLRPDRC